MKNRLHIIFTLIGLGLAFIGTFLWAFYTKPDLGSIIGFILVLIIASIFGAIFGFIISIIIKLIIQVKRKEKVSYLIKGTLIGFILAIITQSLFYLTGEVLISAYNNVMSVQTFAVFNIIGKIPF